MVERTLARFILLNWARFGILPHGGEGNKNRGKLREMARSDLLVSLVKAGATGDLVSFRRALDTIIAEERGKKHDVLADRLTEAAATSRANGTNGHLPQRATPHAISTASDLYFEKIPRLSLDDLVLPEAVTQPLAELIQEQHRSEILRAYNLTPRHKILLAGEPGNGKTSLAEGIAHALMVPFIVARYDGLIASYLGETSSRLRKLFDFARTRACVLFFDEFDTVGKERGDVHESGEIKRVVSSLLLQIDDLPPHVVVVTATNHPELLDRAVWRRFQLRLRLPMPSLEDIEQYFVSAQQRLKYSLGFPARKLAEELQGATFSEIEDFLADVARRYVLSLPDGDVRRIVQQRLTQWQNRFRPGPQGD